MGILRLSLLIILICFSTAQADWYILIPKHLPKRREMPKNVPVPKIAPKKKNMKPYKVEVRKLLAPDFTVRTADLKKISLADLNGKKVVIAFVNNVYSPVSESLIYQLKQVAQKEKDTTVIVIDVNDADFAVLKRFKREMGLNKIHLTADSYVYKQFKSKLDKLEIPSLVIIDKYGFIRYLAKGINSSSVNLVGKEVSDILNSLA
ncbi:Peroxiredoxin [Desulfurobacterium pacificum]|uniref:Peroxiredoxin n=1 Tax=Desulfurobacterium pacificum TaxID=240166 RepID=A0ABY1NSV6_9BACT|nr:redoxin domain-containing protein [Desulfurobacterium pacificum]SMP16035.1 Peroxiredoxin [Desulfurobacterium pacificum]